MPIAEVLILLIGGFFAGLIGALFGLGGGILVIPILVLVLDVPMHNAIATSLLCVIATSSAAASRNILRGVANVRLGVTLEMWTVMGAIVGGLAAGVLSGTVLTFLFAIVMAVMAVPMARGAEAISDEETVLAAGSDEHPERGPFSHRLDGEYFDPAAQSVVRYRIERLPLALLVSGLAGTLSGLLGIGGGILKVPVLVTWCRIPIKAAAATSNFMIGVTAVAGAFVFYGRGDVMPLITGVSVMGVFLGSRSGAALAAGVRASRLRKAFAVVMVVVALQMLVRALGRGIG